MIALDNVILFDRNLGYQNDANFVRAFQATARTAQDQTLELRLNTLAWAGIHALQIGGDFAHRSGLVVQALAGDRRDQPAASTRGR
jgi:hypothetical protein